MHKQTLGCVLPDVMCALRRGWTQIRLGGLAQQHSTCLSPDGHGHLAEHEVDVLVKLGGDLVVVLQHLQVLAGANTWTCGILQSTPCSGALKLTANKKKTHEYTRGRIASRLPVTRKPQRPGTAKSGNAHLHPEHAGSQAFAAAAWLD
eukprot:982778-Pelagomonas_calceolata.AAC.9